MFLVCPRDGNQRPVFTERTVFPGDFVQHHRERHRQGVEHLTGARLAGYLHHSGRGTLGDGHHDVGTGQYELGSDRALRNLYSQSCKPVPLKVKVF